MLILSSGRIKCIFNMFLIRLNAVIKIYPSPILIHLLLPMVYPFGLKESKGIIIIKDNFPSSSHLENS